MRTSSFVLSTTSPLRPSHWLRPLLEVIRSVANTPRGPRSAPVTMRIPCAGAGSAHDVFPCASAGGVPRPRHEGFRRAYTLIELLLVVALLGLAGAILVPRLIDPDTLGSQAAVRLIIADLTFAQSDALANQEYRRVHFFEDGSGYCIVRIAEDQVDVPFDPDTADYISDPLAPPGQYGAYIVKFEDRFPGVQITPVTLDGGRTWVTYDELGGTVGPGGGPGTGGEITVISPNAMFKLRVAPFTGRLTVEKLG